MSEGVIHLAKIQHGQAWSIPDVCYYHTEDPAGTKSNIFINAVNFTLTTRIIKLPKKPKPYAMLCNMRKREYPIYKTSHPN